MPDNELFSESRLKIAYKLLHDLLLLLIIFFILALIAEGMLPGIVSSRIGLYKIVLAVLLVIFFTEAASKKAGVDTSSFSGKKTNFILIFILTTLIINGMRSITLPVSIFILILALTVLYLFYKIFFSPTTAP